MLVGTEWAPNGFTMNLPMEQLVQPEINIIQPALVEDETPQIIYQPNHDVPEVKPLPFEVALNYECYILE